MKEFLRILWRILLDGNYYTPYSILSMVNFGCTNMLFTDPNFIFYFMPVALILHSVVCRVGNRREYSPLAGAVLFFLTLIFYGAQQSWWLYPFCLTIAFDFLWANLLFRVKRSVLRKLILTISIFQNLSLLAFFKYGSKIPLFFQRISPGWVPFLPSLSQGGEWVGLLPGISFYTFESLSFVIDIYRRKISPPKHPLQFFAFIGMFPRFVAGPIVRYNYMVEQFENYSTRKTSMEHGLFVFVVGLFLKTCFADSFAHFTHFAFDIRGSIATFSAWIGVIAYTFQLYFDFFGYSLMAMGLGECLGFKFPTNFDKPYTSRSLQEFWRRWHMSLSAWLRDYLYFSLGGSRKGRLRTYLNIFITMLIGGIWHGSSFNFLIWGAWHGIFLCLERFFQLESRVHRFLHQGITILIVMGGWVWFRAADITEALKIFKAMVFISDQRMIISSEGFLIHPISAVFCGFAILYFILFEFRSTVPKFFVNRPLTLIVRGTGLLMFGLSLLNALSQPQIPFLYYQF